MAEKRVRVADILSRHVAGMGALPQQKGTDADRSGLRCSCGKWSMSVRPGATRPWGEFHLHVADVILEEVEDADD